MGTYEQLDEWRSEVLPQFQDHRIVDEEFLDLWTWFWYHLYADLNEYDAIFTGASWRQKDGYWLLVLKVCLSDIPHVVFVSSKNPTSCVRKLREQLRAATCTMYVDKYA